MVEVFSVGGLKDFTIDCRFDERDELFTKIWPVLVSSRLAPVLFILTLTRNEMKTLYDRF